MQLLDTLNDIAADCYLDKIENVLVKVNDLIEYTYKSIQPAYEKQLVIVAKTIMVAIQNKDSVLIGDCLIYGIKPLIQGKEINEDFFFENNYTIPSVNEEIFYYFSYLDELILCVKSSNGIVVRLNSLFSPQKEVENWVSNIPNLRKKTPVVCLFGIGTGLFAEALLRNLSGNSKLLIYEPCKGIYDYCIKSGNQLNSDTSEIKIKNRIQKILGDDRVTFIFGDNDTFSAWLNQFVDYSALKGIVVVKHNNYDKLFSKEYISFLHEINSYRSMKYVNKNTIAFFREKIVDNILNNICMYKKANLYYELEKILPREIPVFLISAGPSLEKNIDVLKQVKGHGLIFAVDTAINYLLKNEIVPDLTISVDPNKLASCYSEELSHSIPSIFDVTANSEIVEKHYGRCFIFNTSNNYMSTLLGQMNKQLHLAPSGGCVATSAFRILYELNQKKIILIGQDLAYFDGKTYAGGLEGNAMHEKSLVEGIDGKMIMSRSDWIDYLHWFEMAIETIKSEGKEIEVIDATEGGAKIHGAEIKSLMEAIEGCRNTDGKLPEYVFSDELEKLKFSFSEEDYKKLTYINNNSLEKLKEISLKADEAIRNCNLLLSDIIGETISATSISKREKEIKNIYAGVSRMHVFSLINDYYMDDIFDEISTLKMEDGNIKTATINDVKILKITFEAIEKAATELYNKARKIRN